MVNITLPDGKKLQYEEPVSGLEAAKSISEGFARNCVAMEINGVQADLSTEIKDDTSIVFITTKDEEGLHIMRHSAAHVLAEAVTNLYPDAKLTIGPVIEDGFYYDIDMPPVSEEDFSKIEAEMKAIVKAKKPFVRKMTDKSGALETYNDNKYKIELIQELEDGTISIYENGAFSDLCRGPHVPHTGFVKSFKIMKASGAYWRADAEREQLQRIYGTAFFDKKELKQHLHVIEEAKKRDHRKLGTALDLFSFHDEAAGMPFFHARGMALWNTLLAYWREEHTRAGYVETKTPIMLNRALWERSGHWENYRENMYTSVIEDTDFAIKPMNCPGGMLLYKTRHHSYNDLPIRAGEIGLVHRHELSGVLSGLFRVRAFHQDDAHIFMMPDQIESEILGVLQLVERMYSTFDLGFELELSTRPSKSIGTDEQWDMATNGLKSALASYGREYRINEGDGAFYGPKIDIHIKDALGRTWQCGTVQLDMSLPERFDLSYVGADNDRHRPVMIHRVIYGSIERFLGILIEHYAGKFPLWLAPCQIKVLAMNDDVAGYAGEIKKKLEEKGLRVEIDTRAESINKKVRDAQLEKIPIMLTVGNKEMDAGTVAPRTLDGKVKYGVKLDQVLEKILPHIESRSPGIVEF